MDASAPRKHVFDALAFVENFSLKEMNAALPEARRTPHELRLSIGEGEAFVFPFGAVVFRNVPKDDQPGYIQRLTAGRGPLTPVASEAMVVREDRRVSTPGIDDGVLVVDELTPSRSGVVALTLAQSAAMEYYERIASSMFGRTGAWVDRLVLRGTVTMRLRPLHRFIGEAIESRNEVIAVLHLLDKPDAAWDDVAMSAIYDDLRDEFDLVDRYMALEHGLRAVQESLELILDVARDRRLVLLEVAIVALILLEIVLSVVRVAR